MELRKRNSPTQQSSAAASSLFTVAPQQRRNFRDIITHNTAFTSMVVLRSRRSLLLPTLSVLSVILILGWQRETITDLLQTTSDSKKMHYMNATMQKQETDAVLNILVENGAYRSKNFSNEVGIIPPFWQPSNTTAPCKPDETTTTEVGPCFGTHDPTNWEELIEDFGAEPRATYNKAGITSSTSHRVRNDWAGHCRPGFLIIGAGKCGTSVRLVLCFASAFTHHVFLCFVVAPNATLQSLYHYLTEHPRVLPASEKQIHYFKVRATQKAPTTCSPPIPLFQYYSTRPMKWYLHHFPTTTSFLASGALMTGEASPGYLPYPDVVRRIHNRLPSQQTKFIAIGRNPLERAYSSYRYNYVAPIIESMQRGKKAGIQGGLNETYYEQFLFSFEDMLEAELKWLRSCLAVPNGAAVEGARDSYAGSQPWLSEYERRQSEGLDPLVDLDGSCYGAEISKEVVRGQWAELMEQYPEKVITKSNVHLVQSFLGRSLYVLPLEWWYAVFDPSEIYFICTEELQDMSGEPLNDLGQFLGLSSFDFSAAVQKGAYNVGGHRGYDKEISWNEFNASRAADEARLEIPLTEELRQEVEAFVQPYNERLFQLVGRRCNW